MIGIFKSKQWAWARVDRLEAWSLDRNWHAREAERCLKSRNYADAEVHWTAAIEQAERYGASIAKRVRLRLRLAETQRRLPDLRAAETTVREALTIAAQVSDDVSYMNGLDALADVFHDLGDFQALQKLEEKASASAS
jgi:hypothetical protein